MTKEYIEREAALKALDKALDDATWSMDQSDVICQMLAAVENLPVENIEPPKYGKWISASTKPGVNAGMKCSECKARISYSEHINGQHLYCHKCGARMLKE